MTPESLSLLLREADEIRAAKDSTRAAIYTVFGIVLPVTATVLVAVYNKDLPPAARAILGGAFVALISLTTIWTQYLWTEYFSYLEFYYTELMPRIYVASGEGARLNYLQWTLPRRRSEWLPIALFNCGSLAVMIAAFFLCIWPTDNYWAYLVALFPVAVAVSLTVVVSQLLRLQAKVRPSETEDDG